MSRQDYISPVEDMLLTLLDDALGHRAMIALYAGEAGAMNVIEVMQQIVSGGPAVLLGYFGDSLDEDDTTGAFESMQLRFGAYVATRNLTGQQYQQRDAYPLITACRRAARKATSEVIEGEGLSMKVQDVVPVSVQPVINTPDVMVYLVNFTVNLWVQYTE
jgi:hypothetical protein